ncbi:MAG: phosphate ABC transporter substrate-binding protein [Deltaproteobacteria bacterium]|nr:phosphate ABC transporter substrate-binding protein [Deltaproteobacteria bacterium]
MKEIAKKILSTVVASGLLLSCLMVAMTSSPADAGGNRLTITGSTTVLPIAQRAAEDFMEKHAEINISVQGGGSGVGIASLIDGTCDIADASRPIKDKELERAVARGIDPKANVVAMDGIALIVNTGNSLQSLTKAQVKAIYTGKVSDWSAVGGGSGQIVVVSRDSASGTFEAFGELALDKERVRPDALMQASNQAVATTVAKTPGAIGYVGLGYLTPDVRSLVIDGVMPTKETVLTGEYGLARPLFMYTNGKPTGYTKNFIDFVLSEEGQKIVEEVGYVGLK